MRLYDTHEPRIVWQDNIDLFNGCPPLGNSALIVGTGPNGPAHLKRAFDAYLPSTVIMLNMAMSHDPWLKIVPADFWLVGTPTYWKEYRDHNPNFAWWGHALKNCEEWGTRIVFTHDLYKFPDQRTKPDFTYRHNPMWQVETDRHPPYTLVAGLLRCNGTVAGMAVQMATQLCDNSAGKPQIYLCGVDMAGPDHAFAQRHERTAPKDGNWMELPILQSIVDVCSQYADIYSVSPTALNIQMA